MSTGSSGRRIVLASVGASLILALTAGLVSAGPSSRTRDAGPEGWGREVLDLMNTARSRHDLAPLRVNRRLSVAALAHTRRMIAERRVFRTANMAELVDAYGATLWAEELARGSTLEANVRAWLNQADTRRHLLDPRMRHAAIGVLFANGRFWVTVYLHN
jgi:uncharacterized protein YkwD